MSDLSLSDLKLISETWIAMNKNADVNALLAAVAQNPQDETFDIAASAEPLNALHNKLIDDGKLRECRDAIKNVLILVHGAFYRDNLSESAKLQRTGWLFENCVRLQKLLIVSRFMAYANLASFSTPMTAHGKVDPTPFDIPMYIVQLWALVQQFKSEDQEAYRRDYTERCLSGIDDEFMLLCPPEHKERSIAALAAFRSRFPRFTSIKNHSDAIVFGEPLASNNAPDK